MGGFEVLAWLRTRPDLDQLPVVVLSCSPLLEDIAKAQELGATDYKVKPVLGSNGLQGQARSIE
ncbi:Response regulator receiver protein (fragment) [Verrucomicrobia bacterium]